MILGADTASENYELLLKHENTLCILDTLQRRLCFAAAGAVLEPQGGNRAQCYLYVGGIC